MGSQAQRRPSVRQTAVHHVVKASRHGASWLYDFLASQLVGLGLTVLLVALGIGYKPDDSRVDKAAVTAARQAGSSSIADGYAAFAKEVDSLKETALGVCPEGLRDWVSHISLVAAGLALAVGAGLALLRAPSRAHVLRDIGWGIAMPGVLGVLVTAVLEWRAMKGIKATLTGDRAVATLWHEGKAAAGEALPALALPLLAGTWLLIVGVALQRKWRRMHGGELAVRHVVAHFLIVAGLVPWVHLVGTILIEAFTAGDTTGAMLAPWVDQRGAYMACVALFSFGAALFFAARREILRIEAEEEAAEAKKR